MEAKRLRLAERMLMLKAISNLSLAVENVEKGFEKFENNNENNFEKLVSTMNENTVALIRALEGLGKSKGNTE